MLVLSRTEGQRVMIGDDIVVTVIRINSYQVRLGFEAPSGVPIHREEVVEAIKREQSDADERAH